MTKLALQKIQAKSWLFPLAALYALLVLPLSVLAILGQINLPGLAHPYAHAHELLFGVAFLVICGYLLGNLAVAQLARLILMWLLARACFWTLGFHPLVSVFAALAAAMLVWQVVPAFWRAKKWQNRSVAPIVSLVGLCTALAGSDMALFARLLTPAYAVLSALMLFMGGRIIAPLLASFWLQRGQRMGNRVQPNLEGAGLLALAAALLLELAGWWPQLGGLAFMLAAALVLLRILRWRPWIYLGRLDIAFLFIGYAALALALLLQGLKPFWPTAWLLSTHALTVAALGVLMVTIMARVTQVKKFKDANHLWSAHIASALLVLAAVCRLLAPLLPGVYLPLLHVAMLGWSMGFACLLWLFWRCR